MCSRRKRAGRLNRQVNRSADGLRIGWWRIWTILSPKPSWMLPAQCRISPPWMSFAKDMDQTRRGSAWIDFARQQHRHPVFPRPRTGSPPFTGHGSPRSANSEYRGLRSGIRSGPYRLCPAAEGDCGVSGGDPSNSVRRCRRYRGSANSDRIGASRSGDRALGLDDRWNRGKPGRNPGHRQYPRVFQG